MILTMLSDSGGKKKENDHALNYKEISLRDHRNGPSRPISPKLWVWFFFFTRHNKHFQLLSIERGADSFKYQGITAFSLPFMLKNGPSQPIPQKLCTVINFFHYEDCSTVFSFCIRMIESFWFACSNHHFSWPLSPLMQHANPKIFLQK